MSSASVFRALADDSDLRFWGIEESTIFPDYSSEEVPRDGAFLVLRWGNEDVTSSVKKGPEILTVWAHLPQEMGSDYGPLRDMLGRVKDVLLSMEHVVGDDGYSVTLVEYFGSSGNLIDPGFRTITRNMTFRVLLRMVV